MAYQFCDIFANVNSASLSPWENTSGTITYGSQYARFAPPPNCLGGGVFLANDSYMRKNLASNQATFICFMSFGIPKLPPTQQSAIMALLDAGNAQCFLGVNPDGSLQLYRGGFTATSNATAPSLITPSTKPIYGIEMRVTINNTTGSVTVWLNGTQVLNQTGINTRQSANNFANQFQISGVSGSVGNSDQGLYTDYVRVWDSTGTNQNTATGNDRRPVTKLPIGAGTFTNWSPVGLPTNWQCVAQNPPNTSNYVSTSTAGATDSYNMKVVGFLSAPSMVVARSYMQKDDGATRTYANGVLSGSSQGLGSPVTAASGLLWVDSCISNDPATGAVWTGASADAAQFLHQEVS
jgi:hypothetical protein